MQNSVGIEQLSIPTLSMHLPIISGTANSSLATVLWDICMLGESTTGWLCL